MRGSVKAHGEMTLLGPTARTDVEVVMDAVAELQYARSLHPAYHSGHEGYAVILEELDELWEEVRKRHQDKVAMRREAIQVAATALRCAVDVCGEEESGG